MNKFPWLFHLPNIPLPLHGLAPRVIKGQKWWSDTKKEAKAKLNQHCWACGVHKYDALSHRWLEARPSGRQKVEGKRQKSFCQLVIIA